MKKSICWLIVSVLCGSILADNSSEDRLLKVWQGNNQMLIPWVEESAAPKIDGVIESSE